MGDWQSAESKSHQLFERARQVLVGATTRDAVWINPYPPYVSRGEGAYVFDVDDNRYLDLTNNLGVLIHGHNHPAISAAAHEQIDKGVCFALPTESEIALAELLCDRVESFERVRFINTGSEAVTIAIKAARAYTGRTAIAKIEGVYHGSYDFIEVSTASNPDNWGNSPETVPAVKSTPQAVLDEVIVLPANDLAESERILRANAHRLAAVVLDPVPPRCGMIPLEEAYIQLLRSLTHELNSLLIYDEVIALRYGYGGAQGRYNGDPDLTAMGKIIGGGYPVGAVAGHAQVMEAFAADAPSSGTFTGNPLTMRAGLASMELLTQERFDYLDQIGETVRTQLTNIIKTQGVNWQVVGTGSLFGLYPHQREVKDYRSYYKSPEELKQSAALHRAALTRGVLLASTCTGFLSTVITEQEIDQLCTTMSDVFKNIETV